MAFHVGVVDSSAAIDLKKILKPKNALAIIEGLKECARNGKIAYPDQVYTECCTDSSGADLGSVFIEETYDELKHDTEVDHDILHEVLEHHLGSLLIPQDCMNPHHADPYVVAMAIQIERQHFDVSVVCHEVDKVTAHSASITAVCNEFGIAVVRMEDFLATEGLI
jgi:hypothetical protein